MFHDIYKAVITHANHDMFIVYSSVFCMFSRCIPFGYLPVRGKEHHHFEYVSDDSVMTFISYFHRPICTIALLFNKHGIIEPTMHLCGLKAKGIPELHFFFNGSGVGRSSEKKHSDNDI